MFSMNHNAPKQERSRIEIASTFYHSSNILVPRHTIVRQHPESRARVVAYVSRSSNNLNFPVPTVSPPQ